MDSMRSLNTSLPGNTSPSKQQDPPEQLLAAFKAAALSVTNLYKSAAADQGRARSEGYQDALDELLAYLDKEDIGLSDGEGWKVRRWATERLRDSAGQNMESDEDTDKDRGSSPVLQRSHSSTRIPPAVSATRSVSPARTSSAPPTIITPQVEESTTNSIPQAMFTFRSQHAYPQDADIILADLESSDSSRSQNHDSSATSHATPQTAPRTSRTRHTSHSSRHGSRTISSIGRGAGQKRKINFSEFFDVGNLGHGNGNGGGGKRGRFA